MAYKPVVVVYDACVLYPFHLRNLLIQCGVDRLVDVRWTDAIHDEWIRNLAAHASNVPVERLTKTRDLMKQVLPAANVTSYEKYIPQLTLPDLDDCHILAAAIAGSATLIVTWNLADFPTEALVPYHVTALNPDDFLMDLYRMAPDAMIVAVANARKNLRKTAPNVAAFIDALERQKLTHFSVVLRRHSDEL
ncbi:MAG: PIN domain-containing protein [Alphaproteobacteria bacterium]|nr:PIN domain-containing protein [Alphaproteobacteria bacterium]MDE2111528.1 PIN domain-containing protein [Alphaproteobacteria bacterium]MDE2494972.1 PIN domain-containing protein [Alphaproteobacteria bacterium]